MLSKNQINHIKSLHQRKFREQERLFIAEGTKLVTEFLRSNFKVTDVYFDPATAANITEAVSDSEGTRFHEVTGAEMERITALSSPSPVLAVVSMPIRDEVPAGVSGDELVLVLDDIRDPGNMGTIIRIADWFGISRVIVSDTSVDVYNPKVVQSTMGSLTRVNVSDIRLGSFFSTLPGDITVYGTFMEGENIYQSELSAGGIIVIGGEANGISPGISSLITKKISIPLFAADDKLSRPESLNAATATAIICSEFRRRTSETGRIFTRKQI